MKKPRPHIWGEGGSEPTGCFMLPQTSKPPNHIPRARSQAKRCEMLRTRVYEVHEEPGTLGEGKRMRWSLALEQESGKPGCNSVPPLAWVTLGKCLTSLNFCFPSVKQASSHYLPLTLKHCCERGTRELTAYYLSPAA